MSVLEIKIGKYHFVKYFPSNETGQSENGKQFLFKKSMQEYKGGKYDATVVLLELL